MRRWLGLVVLVFAGLILGLLVVSRFLRVVEHSTADPGRPPSAASSFTIRRPPVPRDGPSHQAGGVRLAVCTRLRNEGIYLKEWLEFHLLVGVDHFYIFDDGSTDNTLAVLRSYEARGVVHVWPVLDHSHDSDHGQYGHRDECLGEKNVMNATWVAMIDADEFLFPSHGASVADHIDRHCHPDLAFLMIRWHMFGSNGLLHRPNGSVVDHYRMHSFVDSTVCPSDIMGCFDVAPPLSTKLIANTRCVKRVGTHYATKLADDPSCFNIYTPLGSKETRVVDSDEAKAMHKACVLPLHLNHYAVKSREDYLGKFQRGRISRGDKDVQAGLATRDEATGQVQLRPLSEPAVRQFLGDADVDGDTTRGAGLSRVDEELLALAVHEFMVRDFSEVRNEAILKFLPALRRRMPHLFFPRQGPEAIREEEEDRKFSEPLRALHPNLAPAPRAIASACFTSSPPQFRRDRDVTLTSPHALSPNVPLIHLHIPKTGGTNFNLQLRAMAEEEGRVYCEVRTSDAHRLPPPAASKRCSVVSGEFDFSIIHSLRKARAREGSAEGLRVQAMTMLRDPISRAASQFEHHISRDRFRAMGEEDKVRRLERLASPYLCPQMERKQSRDCGTLSNPLKCLANGWCGIFQNHQTEMLAGAMSYAPQQRQALRRSSDQLLCTAIHNLHTLAFVGLVEHYDASLCLFLHTFRLHDRFRKCCVPASASSPSPPSPRGTNASVPSLPSCNLFRMHTKLNSAAERSQGQGYLDVYMRHDGARAALYAGNREDCELYRRASILFRRRLMLMEAEHELPRGLFSGKVDPRGYAPSCASAARTEVHESVKFAKNRGAI